MAWSGNAPLVATAAVAGLVLMALVAVFALAQRSNARAEARDARARELDAVAVALLPTDPELGLVLARESASLSPTSTAEDVLRQALLWVAAGVLLLALGWLAIGR